MKPTFQSDCGNVTLYCGDGVEIAKTIQGVDCVCTDPPYGIGRDGQTKTTSKHGGRKHHAFRGWDKSPPTKQDIEYIIKCAPFQVIWGANYFPYALPSSMGWLVWDKGQRICQSDAELAFTNLNQALRIYTLNRVELMTEGTTEHPTQKPIKLMQWCLEQVKSPVGATVLDPYMGSGTTGIACLRTGRKFIGVEIDPQHYQHAEARIRRELAQLKFNL